MYTCIFAIQLWSTNYRFHTREKYSHCGVGIFPLGIVLERTKGIVLVFILLQLSFPSFRHLLYAVQQFLGCLQFFCGQIHINYCDVYGLPSLILNLSTVPTHLPTVPTYQPTHVPTYMCLPACLSVCLPACLPTYLSICLCNYFYLFIYLPTYCTYLPTYLHTYIPTYLYLPLYLPLPTYLQYLPTYLP